MDKCIGYLAVILEVLSLLLLSWSLFKNQWLLSIDESTCKELHVLFEVVINL